MSNVYQPGTCVRLTTTITQLGVLVNVAPLTITIHASDGSVQTPPSIVNDSTGVYHADFAIPLTGPPGVWLYRWQTTSATPSLNGLGPGQFQVAPLAF